MEATLLEIPSIAFSNQLNGEVNWDVPEKYVAGIIKALASTTIPHDRLINVNFPAVAVELARVEVGVAQEFVLQLQHVLVQRLVGAQIVRFRIALEQHLAELVLRQQLLDLLLGLFGISAEILQGRHGRCGKMGAVTERDGAGREYSTSIRRRSKASLPATDIY